MYLIYTAKIRCQSFFIVISSLVAFAENRRQRWLLFVVNRKKITITNYFYYIMIFIKTSMHSSLVGRDVLCVSNSQLFCFMTPTSSCCWLIVNEENGCLHGPCKMQVHPLHNHKTKVPCRYVHSNPLPYRTKSWFTFGLQGLQLDLCKQL